MKYSNYWFNLTNATGYFLANHYNIVIGPKRIPSHCAYFAAEQHHFVSAKAIPDNDELCHLPELQVDAYNDASTI